MTQRPHSKRMPDKQRRHRRAWTGLNTVLDRKELCDHIFSAFAGDIPVAAAGARFRSFHFATDDLPEPRRNLALWGLRDRGLLPLEPLPDRVAHADISKEFLPGIGVLSGTLSGVRQHASPQMQGARDEVFFAVNLTGDSAA